MYMIFIVYSSPAKPTQYTHKKVFVRFLRRRRHVKYIIQYDLHIKWRATVKKITRRTH